MNDNARYIEVPKASGPNTKKNICGGCGEKLPTEFKHRITDCFDIFNKRIKNLELYIQSIQIRSQ